jgi:hypothetical protein
VAPLRQAGLARDRPLDLNGDHAVFRLSGRIQAEHIADMQDAFDREGEALVLALGVGRARRSERRAGPGAVGGRRDDPAELSRLHPGVDLTRELEHVASPTNRVRRALGPQARAR